MHILIFEIALSGHHANYLEHVSTLFLAEGHKVTVCVQESELGNAIFVRLRNSYPANFEVQPLPDDTPLSTRLARLGIAGCELKNWWAFRRFFKRLNAIDPVDRVFFPYLDYCLHAIALLGPPSGHFPWSGICMRPSFHYRDAGVIAPEPKWGAIKERLFCKLLRQCGLKTIFTIDELLEQHVQQKHPALASRLMFVPDPAELPSRHDQASARSQLGLAQDDFVILVYGAIDPRKGVDQLLQGLHGQQLPRKVRVLVVGGHSPALREQLGHEPLVTSIDGYADCKTEEAAFRAADAVWMGYRDHYVMSGVLILAAMAAKPVLATRNGLIGWMTRRYNLGMTIDCENSLEVTQAVHALLATPPSPLPGSGIQTIRTRHAWSEFNRTILEALCYEKTS